MTETFEVPSQEVRLPVAAVEALTRGRPVAVTRYGRPVHVVLSQEQFARVAPLLELLNEGAEVSPELLMSSEDIELMHDLAEDREPSKAEEDQIAELVEQVGS
jgi:PHD/YefM family antitoxin component YafN of YafNO toxin-antitoxin module